MNVDRYEHSPEAQANPFPAARVNGREIVRAYWVRETGNLHARLVDAMREAEALPPLPDQPEVA